MENMTTAASDTWGSSKSFNEADVAVVVCILIVQIRILESTLFTKAGETLNLSSDSDTGMATGVDFRASHLC